MVDGRCPEDKEYPIISSPPQVSRNIDPADACDLLEQVPRANIAFAGEHGPQAQPVVLVWNDPHYLIGIPENRGRLPSPGQEVVLLVDQGVYFFDLRALYIRGKLQPVQSPRKAPEGHTWFEVIPLKAVAWDYGTLHEVSDES